MAPHPTRSIVQHAIPVQHASPVAASTEAPPLPPPAAPALLSPALPAANIAAANVLASGPPSATDSPVIAPAEPPAVPAVPAATEETAATASTEEMFDDIMARVQSLEDQGRLVEASSLLLQAQASRPDNRANS